MWPTRATLRPSEHLATVIYPGCAARSGPGVEQGDPELVNRHPPAIQAAHGEGVVHRDLKLSLYSSIIARMEPTNRVMLFARPEQAEEARARVKQLIGEPS
jgi:hypothetical protein